MSLDIDLYEKEILEDYESGKLKSSGISDSEKERFSEIAANTLTKYKRVNIRLSEYDLQATQRKAVQEGLPYQALISSLIQIYTNGSLVDKSKFAAV